MNWGSGVSSLAGASSALPGASTGSSLATDSTGAPSSSSSSAAVSSQLPDAVSMWAGSAFAPATRPQFPSSHLSPGSKSAGRRVRASSPSMTDATTVESSDECSDSDSRGSQGLDLGAKRRIGNRARFRGSPTGTSLSPSRRKGSDTSECKPEALTISFDRTVPGPDSNSGNAGRGSTSPGQLPRSGQRTLPNQASAGFSTINRSNR